MSLPTSPARLTTDALLGLSQRELRGVLSRGYPLDPRALDDTQYHGISVGLPRWAERLSWKTFRKTFHRDPATGRLRGWNVRMQQNGVRGERRPLERRGRAWTFGHYEVVPAEGYATPIPHRGLVIDYSLGGNGALDVLRWVKDPLVALREGSAELLLGVSYLEVGPLRLVLPTYFVLELDGPLTDVVAPPSPAR